jgi:DNA repair exonuclease SbcCD ATPase subunit
MRWRIRGAKLANRHQRLRRLGGSRQRVQALRQVQVDARARIEEVEQAIASIADQRARWQGSVLSRALSGLRRALCPCKSVVQRQVGRVDRLLRVLSSLKRLNQRRQTRFVLRPPGLF